MPLALRTLPGLLTLGSGFGDPEEIFADVLPSLMVDLSHRRKFGVLEEPIIFEHGFEWIKDSRGRRAVQFEPAAKALLADASGLSVALSEPQGKKVDFPDAPKAPEEEEGLKPNKAFYPLKKGLPRLCLSLLDSNPLSMVEAHPDKEGNSIDLGTILSRSGAILWVRRWTWSRRPYRPGIGNSV